MGFCGPASRFQDRPRGGFPALGQTRPLANSLRRTRNRLPSANNVKIWAVLGKADGAKGRNAAGVRGKHMRIKEGTFACLVDVGGREETMWINLHGSSSKGLFLRSLESSSAELEGTIGAAFVDRLLNNHQLLCQDLPASHARLAIRLAVDLGIDPDNYENADMRVLCNFAAVWLAGDRAASMGILPRSRDEVEKAVKTAANSWVKIRQIGKHRSYASTASTAAANRYPATVCIQTVRGGARSIWPWTPQLLTSARWSSLPSAMATGRSCRSCSTRSPMMKRSAR